VARRLLADISRFEGVALMIARQDTPFSEGSGKDGKVSTLGGQVLKVALGFDRLLTGGGSPAAAVAELRNRPDEFAPEIVATLENLRVKSEGSQLASLEIDGLDVGMVLQQDVKSKRGQLLVKKGQEVTSPVLERLRHWARTSGVVEPVNVRVPRLALAPQPS